MTRAQALSAIQCAAARGDMAACTRVFCEHRISRAAYDEAVAKGRARGEWIRKRDAEAAIARANGESA